MLRSLFLFLALVFAAAASLTLFKAFNIPSWMVGILVGEFGHWLIVLILVLIALLFVVVPTGFVRQLTLTIFILAALLLAKPTLQAWMIAESLPVKLSRSLGDIPMDHPPFAFDRLVGFRGPEPVAVRTEPFAYVGEPEQLSLDFYPAVVPDGKPAPCVIVVHGGGWDSGEREELPAINHYLARRGYAVASISYRLAPKFRWPAQRVDILTAIAFLKEKADEHGIDPTRFALLGRSAGGNLVEAVAYGLKDKSIRGVIAYYAPADLNFAWTYARDDDVLKSPELLKQFLGGTPKSVKAFYDETSPYDLVTRETTPTLLMHGQLDSLVWHKQSERLDVRLSRNSVPHYFLSLPWATHAFDYNLRGPGGQLSTYTLEYFLAAVMKDEGLVAPKLVAPPPPEPVGKGKGGKRAAR